MEENRAYNKTKLDNGVTIISELDANVYSATIGVWVKKGSRNERDLERGISHFIEHMLFKGTSNRNCLQIAREIDALGGVLNAFTTHESTCYYVKLLKEHAGVASSILEDIFVNSLFDADEIERERKVILQEISMIEDAPDDQIHDLFAETFWGDHPLGRPVTGTIESVSSFKRDDFLGFVERNYRPENIVIAAAGNVDHDRVVNSFSDSFSRLKKGPDDEPATEPVYSSNLKFVKKKLEQVHFCLGTKGVSSANPRRYAAYMMNSVLGDGMSSRLFQEIREKRGLAYSIYSYMSTYQDSGNFGICAGTGKGSFSESVELAALEMKKMREKKISGSELSSVKEQMKSGILISMENSESRMQRIADNEMTFGRNLPVEEIIENIESVTVDDVHDMAGELLREESLNLAVLGNLKRGVVESTMEKVREMLKG